MSALGKAAFGLSKRLRRSRSLELLATISDRPLDDPETVRRKQMAALGELLLHCKKHVPYYRKLFAELGFEPGDVRNIHDLAALPPLTKDLVRAHERDLVRDDVPLASLSQHHSGGSTGIPLRFHRDRYYMDISEAGTYRNLLQSGWQPGEMVAFFWGFNDRLNRMGTLEFEARQYARRFYQFDPFRSGQEDMERWIPTFRRIRPAVAYGYASTIARFAEHIEATGKAVRPLKGVFTTAEQLLEPQREVISRVFSCTVYDCYGSSEVQNIATQCSTGGMHVNADFVVLEAEASPEGVGAPLLVTSLHNYAMPFLRYRNEDVGALRDESCPCGSGFSLMDLRVGRLSDNFLLPGNRVVHGEFFTHLFYGCEGVDRFQFRQTAPDHIDLYIVPGTGSPAGRAAVVRSVIERVEALAPERIGLSVKEVAEIPLTSTGKHRFTVSEVGR